jgi:CheY-like chemotaxis protein
MAALQGAADEDGGRKRQLVVVVESTTRDAAATTLLLQNFGYTVMTVRTAEEALELLSIAAPALIITEMVLPSMSGFDLLARVREDDRLASIPVIVQTALQDLASEERCRGIGCTLYLRKPVPTEVLYRAVQSTIEATPRQNLRAAVYLKASIDGAGIGAELLTVLSDDGMFIKTLSPRPVGTRHTVSFMLDRRIIKVEAAVLYVYGFDEGPGKDPGMGMSFLTIDPADRELLRDHIRKQLNPRITPAR